MAEIINTIVIDQAKEMAAKCSYGLLYKTDSIDLIKISADTNIDEILEACYEARFFDEEQEIRFLRDDDADITGQFRIAAIEETACSSCLRQDKKYVLANRYKRIGKSVIIRQYLVPDADGQMCVKATRLVGIEV